MTRKETIEAVVKDLVSAFLYYDRKEDEDLPKGQIQEAIKNGEISMDEIVELFKGTLSEGLKE